MTRVASMVRRALFAIGLGVLLGGAGYVEVDAAAQKQELIEKLSADINKVQHAIQVTKELIRKSPDAPYLPDLYFRLAELYVEKSRYVFARLMEQQPSDQKVLDGEKALEVQITKRLAIETYDKLLADYAEFPQNDQVRFFRAHEYRELGEWDAMLRQYEELIAAYPKSVWAIEARLILADYYFDKGELDRAEARYVEITELAESHLHDMARYKLGWIRINQERFKDALAYFEAAVTSTRKERRGAIGDAKRLDVKREALLALTWPFTEVRKASQAVEYLRGLADSKTLYVEALKKLANRYFIKTDYISAALLYREIVQLSADVEQNIEFVQRIYDSVRNMSARNPRRYSNAEQDVEAIVSNLARFQNHWRFPEEDQGKLAHDFELRARDLATRLHVEAQQSKDAASAAVAARAYHQYLALFGASPQRKTIELNRAEALYQAGSYVSAGLQYEDVAHGLGESNEQRDVLYSAILAFHRALDEDAEYRDKHPGEDGQLGKLDLLVAREGLKQLGVYYVRRWPQGDKAASVKFNIARMYYQQGEYQRAAELFASFVEEYPRHKDVATAGRLALDALHQLDAYDELAKIADRFAKNTRIEDRRFRGEAARTAEASRRRKVEFAVMEASSGDFSEVMLAEWEKHKGTKEGEEYLYTAFVKYKSEANVAGVFDFGGRLLGAYEKSARIPDVLATMGSFAVRAADFERAAAIFEEYYRRFPKQGNAIDLLMSAARIRVVLGDDEAAAKDLRLMRRFGASALQREAHLQLMQIYAEARAWDELASVAQTAATFDRRWAAPPLYLGLAYAESDKPQLAERELAAASRLAGRTAEGRSFAARASFELGRLQQRKLEALQYAGAETAEQVLGAKLSLLESSERSYVAAIGGGDGTWAIAALHGATQLYRGMAQSIRGVPLPATLTTAEKKQVDDALAAQAKQYDEKQRDTLRACATKAKELRVLTAFAAACVAGSDAVPSVDTKRRRGHHGDDEGYQRELATMRQKLATQPENIELLTTLAARAMRAGDYHLARMVLAKASEIDSRNGRVANLLGVVLWQLGDPQAAADALEKARRQRVPEALVNLAALYAEYGYEALSRQVLSESGGVGSLDLKSVDLHPSVQRFIEEPAS